MGTVVSNDFSPQDISCNYLNQFIRSNLYDFHFYQGLILFMFFTGYISDLPDLINSELFFCLLKGLKLVNFYLTFYDHMICLLHAS